MDLDDFWRTPGKGKRRKIGWRKLVILIEYLPPESASMTGLRVDRARALANGSVEPEPDDAPRPDPKAAPWSASDMLLALIAEEIRNLQYMYIRTHAPKGARVEPPARIDRPGVEAGRRKPKLSMSERMLLDPRLRQRVAETSMEGRKLAQEITTMQEQRRARIEDV